MFFDTKTHILYETEPFCSCAQDEDMAYCMALMAYAQGCHFLLATPPADAFLNALQNPEEKGIPEIIQERFTTLKQRILESESMPEMKLVGLGCEIPCTRQNLDRMIEHLDMGHLPTLNNSGYVLLSFQEDVSREELWACLDRLDRAGYQSVISHVQRIQTLKGDPQEIRCLKGEGLRGEQYQFKAKIQLDTLSLQEPAYNTWWSEQLIREGLVDVLATDARNTFTHPPHIAEELERAKPLCSQDYFEKITFDNAQNWFVPRA